MKRHFMKGLKALSTGVMTFCVASFCFTSCYDDSALNERLDYVEDKIDVLDEKIEAIKTQLQDLTSRVDALYTLQFQVNDSNELQYSFDGGATWVSTGVTIHDKCTCVVPDPCTCKEVSLVDNGESVTITVGDQSFTIEKPKEISFEIRAGKVYFESEGTQNIAIKSSGVADVTVMSYPKGWYAEIASDGTVQVTAPNFADTQSEMDYETWTEIPAKYAAEGYVKIHACGVDGKCMVGKLPVVVSGQPVSVKAFAGNAHFYATGTWPAMFYYGASPRESFETEVASLLEQLNARGWADWNANGDGYENEAYVTAPIEQLLGAKVEDGKEYVVYAIIEDYNKTSYSIEDFIVAYYSQVNVSAVENEAEKTPYNITVTVDVEGADSYYAVAMPQDYVGTEEDLEMYKENLVGSLSPDSWSGPMGKLYNDSYTGSLLDIAEGTTASMAGAYRPDSKVYLLVLPMDGRSWDEYTAADVFDFSFTTAPLSAGGSIDATAALVDKYTVTEFDWTLYQEVTKEVIVNKNFQLVAELNPSATTGWKELYYLWISAEDWALYGSDDALLVDHVCEYSYGMTPSDIEGFPLYAVEAAEPETTKHFVAFFVDESGKYGQIAKIKGTTEKVENSEIAWNDPISTNLVDKVLKNATSLEVDLSNATDMPASKYKYVWTESSSWNRPFEGKTDAEVALSILAGEGYYIYTEVTAEELQEGKLVIEDHSFGSEYYLAILPYDAEGKPGKSAAIFEYSCAFVLENLVTEPSEYVNEPTVNVYFPTEDAIYPDDGYGDGAYASYSYNTYAETYSFYYAVSFDFTPVEGTEVAAALVDANNYSAFAAGDANSRAAGLWQKSFGSYYTYISTEFTEPSFRGFNQLEGNAVPDIYLAISWKDAEGNYYYREVAFKDQFQALYDKMISMIYGEQTEALSVDNKQWLVPVEVAANEMIVGQEARSVLDLGDHVRLSYVWSVL